MFFTDTCDDRVVMRFQHRRADDEGIRIEEPGRQVDRNHVRVLVEHRPHDELALLREVYEFELLPLYSLITSG